jgi:murein DD-endopeptidase MepM/ murein hydrolase activator NlpD
MTYDYVHSANPPQDCAQYTDYTVRRGYTLYAIARRNNISLEELLKINPQIRNPHLINIGQTIKLKCSTDGDIQVQLQNGHVTLPNPEPVEETKPSEDVKMSSGFRQDVPLDIPVDIAEYQLNRNNYQVFFHPILKEITITGGFMEPYGHSRKRAMRAIFRNRQIRHLPPANRNIGIDYVANSGKAIAWYGGVVVKQGMEGGYGRRIHVKLDIKYNYEGVFYEVFQAYAHLREIWVKAGQRIEQGVQIGLQGGSSSRSEIAYPVHIDLSTYIWMDGKSVQDRKSVV